MTVATDDFAAWIQGADIPASRRTPELDTLLEAVYRFRQQQGCDYYSTRLLSHFLLHCDCGLKVAQIARLLGISRPCASAQQQLSSKQVIQQAHHRLDGRPYGKLLPRYVGPLAAHLHAHPDASRADLLAFIQRTFSVRVSRIALYKFLKKYGLQEIAPAAQATALPGPAARSAHRAARPAPATPVASSRMDSAAGVSSAAEQTPARSGSTTSVVAAATASANAQTPPSPTAPVAAPLLVPVPPPAPPFSTDERSTRGPSC